MDPHNPINPDNLKDDHSQQDDQQPFSIEPLSPRSEKRLDDFYEWESHENYRVRSWSDDDSDGGYNPWLSNPRVSPDPVRPTTYYPQELPCWATYERPPQGSSSSQNRATVAAEKTTMPVEQEINYFNMLTELTKVDTATMSEAQKKAHDGQIAWLCNKLGIEKP